MPAAAHAVDALIRAYQRHLASGSGAHPDDDFRILLVRVLQELFGSVEDPADLPPHEELLRGLSSDAGRIRYPAESAVYPEFRRRLATLFDSSLVPRPRAAEAERLLAPFDRAYPS